MQRTLLASPVLAAILSATLAIASLPLLAQTPPANTYHPGFWQPVARVNVRKPIVFKLINETSIPLEYDTPSSELAPPPPKSLGVGETAEIKDLPLPANLLIYASNTIAATEETSTISLKFEIAVDKNNVAVVRIRQISDDTTGNGSINLQKTGAIYVY
jgi:hypothetical protein